MRWFKHLTLSHEDEGLAALLDKYGPIAYGRYWLILETIALQMDGTNRTDVTYTDRKWAVVLRCKAGGSAVVLRWFADRRLMELSSTADGLRINCPKLLKYRDEWTKKSGVTPEQLRSKIQIQRQSIEIELLPEYSGPTPSLKKVRKEPKPKSDHQRFIHTWEEKYQIWFPGEKYVFEGGKDAKSVSTILTRIGVDKAELLIGAFFGTDDQWIINNGSFTISMFLSQINKLIQKSAAAPSRNKEIDDELDRV